MSLHQIKEDIYSIHENSIFSVNVSTQHCIEESDESMTLYIDTSVETISITKLEGGKKFPSIKNKKCCDGVILEFNDKLNQYSLYAIEMKRTLVDSIIEEKVLTQLLGGIIRTYNILSHLQLDNIYIQLNVVFMYDKSTVAIEEVNTEYYTDPVFLRNDNTIQSNSNAWDKGVFPYSFNDFKNIKNPCIDNLYNANGLLRIKKIQIDETSSILLSDMKITS